MEQRLKLHKEKSAQEFLAAQEAKRVAAKEAREELLRARRENFISRYLNKEESAPALASDATRQ